ncbi:MAG: TonB-dependent receptor [Bacteroidales bacterium]|nr:TonB-dependent receptor [Bacteroidales bacterium]
MNDVEGMLDLAADNWWDEETTQHLLNSDPRTYNSYTYENETDNYQQDHYQIIYSNQLSKKLLLNAATHYTYGRGYYEQYKQGRKYEDYQLDDPIIGNDTLSRTDLIQQKWLNNHFYGATYSLNYKNKNLDAVVGGSWNQYLGDHFGEVIWMQNAGTAPKNYEWYSNSGTKTDLNMYAKANYLLGDVVNLYGDIQYRKIDYSIEGIHDDLRDLTQTHSYNFLNPKMGAYYKIANNQNAYTSFAISNREPSRSVFRDAAEDEIPVPERLLDYEFGHEYHSSNFSISTNIFYMDYKDQLVLTGEINDVGAANMTNASDSYRAGIEISTAVKFTQFLDWETNVSYSQNKIKNFISYVENWDNWETGEQIVEELGTVDIAYSPDWVCDNIFTIHPVKNFNVSFITKYVSDQFIDNTSSNERKLDAYLVNDIKMDYTISDLWFKEINFSLALNNVLNEEYETNAWVYRYYYDKKEKVMDGYYPQAGINFMAGIRIKI